MARYTMSKISHIFDTILTNCRLPRPHYFRFRFKEDDFSGRRAPIRQQLALMVLPDAKQPECGRPRFVRAAAQTSVPVRREHREGQTARHSGILRQCSLGSLPDHLASRQMRPNAGATSANRNYARRSAAGGLKRPARSRSERRARRCAPLEKRRAARRSLRLTGRVHSGGIGAPPFR